MAAVSHESLMQYRLNEAVGRPHGLFVQVAVSWMSALGPQATDLQCPLNDRFTPTSGQSLRRAT